MADGVANQAELAADRESQNGIENPVSRGRGRPKGSTKKTFEEPTDVIPRGRGRPRGSGKKRTEELKEATPRGRGRPKGSGKATTEEPTEVAPRGRGRPKGSTRKADESTTAAAPRRRGRPKGSGVKKTQLPTVTTPRGRGRPKGSTKATLDSLNKPATKGKTSNAQGQRNASIAGSYSIKCDDIEQGWANMDDLTLDIKEGPTAGIYSASFDFGVLEGAMLLSADKELLAPCVEDTDSSDEGDDDDVSESDTRTSNKRKARGKLAGKVAKKAKPAQANLAPTKFFLVWRGRETGEGEIQSGEHSGTIEFTNRNYVRFSGDMDMVFVGGSDGFEGTKVSDVPETFSQCWGDFSESAYEYERVSQWR